MPRPRTYTERRVSTQVRLPVRTHRRLHEEAQARDVSVNYLINRAVDDFLEGLRPPEDVPPSVTGRN
jgi:predicted HicB family RNase H-like nuclease